jgi:excisionase family DNA binding protein
MPALVDSKSVAKRFGVSIETVRAWTRQGRIPCIRVNRATVRYSLQEVEKAIEKPIRRNDEVRL